MPRLTISIPKQIYNRVSSIALQNDESMSHIINQLINAGIQRFSDENGQRIESVNVLNPVEQHCYPLIIQMNALIKNLSAEILKFNQDDFERLRRSAFEKYNSLI